MRERDSASGVRRAEVVAALSIATDLAIGQPVEFALQSCVLSMRIGHMLNCAPDELAEIYYQSLLRYIGCNAETHLMAALFGDEIAFRRDFSLIDPGRAQEMIGLVFSYLRRANSGAGVFEMIAAVARGLLTSKKVAVENLAGHCEVAAQLAARLGFDAGVQRNLGQLYERWDGRGMPNGIKGDAIAAAVRIVSFAQDTIVLRSAFGDAETRTKLRERAGSAYEPALVERFLEHESRLAEGIEETTWQTVLALEPAPQRQLTGIEFDQACLAMADFADLKSPYSVGHSRAVAALAAEAAHRLGLPDDDVTDLHRAGLLHDIGQIAVPARVWLKAAEFNDSEREQARLHVYYTERVLARPDSFARLGAIAAQHHERTDGSGYHRGTRGPALSVQGKILACVEAYQNKIEARPHRAALSPRAAADALRREVRDGRLDAAAAEAVLAAAGHAAPARKALVAGLTGREIEVLRAIARGQSTKEVARALDLSPKTVDNHTQSIFSKIGAKTRGGATLFAIEHGLAGPA